MEGAAIAAIVDSLKAVHETTHPVDVGLRSEAVVTARLLARGIKVLQPCGFNHRYDLVLDLDGGFVRAQVKTGRLRGGKVHFATCSVRSNSAHVMRRNYSEQIDIFLVYCAATDEIYAVPVDEAPSGEMQLRVEPTANRQIVGVRWAADYRVPA